MNRLRLSVVMCFSALVAFAPVRAAVEYSSFGANDTYSNAFVNITGATTGHTYRSEADQFTASFTGTLTSIDIAAFGIGSADDVMLRFYTNDPVTNLPLVSSRVFLGDVPVTKMPGGIATLTVGGAVDLTAGQKYWVEVAPGNAVTTAGWYDATNPLANRSAFSIDASSTFTTDPAVAQAFRVNADPAIQSVPEPATWFGGGLSSVLLAFRLWRRKSLRSVGQS